MERLLGDLLEYSKLSQAEIKLSEVDLSKAVAEALALLDEEIRRKNADISVDESLPPVLGHPATVVLIISNLVSNALKFVPNGVTPQISISAQEVEGFATLSVRDNGIGIAKTDLSKLFGIFQRLHGKQTYPGTGLGLAIVRRGAERMGGSVGVESEVGKGSRFWLQLPAPVTSLHPARIANSH
jgi:signal transduction histidine kinase